MEALAAGVDSGNSVKIPERVLLRDNARLEELERRKNAKESQSVSEEKSDYFKATFSSQKAEIEQLLAGCVQSERRAAPLLEEATLKTQQLQKFLNDSTGFLTQYELRTAQASLQTLHSSITEKREEVMPKKKFAFRARTAASTQPPAAAPVNHEEKPRAFPSSVELDSASGQQYSVSNQSDQVLIRRAEDIRQRDVLLSHLTNCKVRLFGCPSTLHIKNIHNCQILSGPVSSSVFVDQCKDSTLVVACQQLRTHNTTDTKIYLHVSSRAIIEDCSGVSFAPYNWAYEELDGDFTAAGLDRNRNNWSSVDDFNWLAAGVPSPNWTVLPEPERTSCWDS